MAAKSGSHSTHATKSKQLAVPGVPKGTHTYPTPYAAGLTGGKLVPSGQKALMFRARKELADVADPNSSLAD